MVHRPKLRNQQLRCILELKRFTRFYWTQPKVSTDRRFPLLIRHIKISIATVMEGTVKYKAFIFILQFPHWQCCDYSKCSSPTVSPVLFVSSCSLQRKSHLLCHQVSITVKQHISFCPNLLLYSLQVLISCVLDTILSKKTQHQMQNLYAQIRGSLIDEPLPNHSAKITLCINEIHG